MPLGLLAKDSIQDLEALLGKGGEAASSSTASSQVNNKQQVDEQYFVESSSSSSTSQQLESSSNNDTLDAAVGRKGPLNNADSNNNSSAYQGFSPEYHHSEYMINGYQDLADRFKDNKNNTLFLGERTEKKSLFCCFFPSSFCGGNPPDKDRKTNLLQEQEQQPLQLSSSTVANSNDKSSNNASSLSTSLSDDEMSSNSDLLGEKLSDQDRQAVLARLRLLTPDSTTTASSSSAATATAASADHLPKGHQLTPDRPTGLLNGVQTFEESKQQEHSRDNDPLAPIQPKPVKGILKNYRSKRPSTIGMDNSLHNNSSLNSVKDATSGSNTDEQNHQQQSGNSRRRSLFPTAVYEKTSRKSLSSGGLAALSSLHVTFAPMARVVTVKSKNDMSDLDKGSVWWQRHDYEDFRRCGRIITRAMVEGGSEIWLAGVSNKASSSSSIISDAGDSKSDSGDLVSTHGDNWWHTFGHSRRGLEHVVSVDEGRERQANVRNAIRAVLEEQNIQRVCKRGVDPEKLRSVALLNTSWARDLALASGSSDADAVKAKFASDRKSREFYLLKMAQKQHQTEKTGRAMPGFMAPRRKLSTTFRLDNHTSNQIRYRRSRQEEKKEVSEPLHDPSSDSSSMARLAAGFSSDGAEKMNMAAVLSGMGAVANEQQGVTA